MSQKIKIVFGVILVLIITSFSTVYAIGNNQIKELFNITNNTVTYEYIDKIKELEKEYTYMAITINSSKDTLNFYFYNNILKDTGYGYSTLTSKDAYRLKYTNNVETITERTNFNIFYEKTSSNNNLDYYFYTTSGIIKVNTTNEYLYEPNYENIDILKNIVDYKKAYYEIILDHKGQSSITANGEKVKAYTYDSIYDTGITTLGKKFLKVGYLYIDDSYLISNLLTSIPTMTKYSMNLINSWEYQLYEGVYTTEETENGYLKYEIRIPIEYVSMSNYYNIYFKSKDTSIESDLNINFVLLNNVTEESGGVIITTPSGDTLSGDYIKDNTTLGDINNTINNLEDKVENIILGTENESGDREGGLLGGILDGIKGLFIPSEEAMGEWLTRTQEEVTDKLGMLGEPINFFSRLMNKLLVGNKEEFVLHIPELIIPGTEYKLLDAFDINFTQMIEEHSVFKTIYDGYIVIISGIMVYCFYSYLWSFYDHLLGTRDVEAAYKITEEEVERQQIIQKEKKRQPIGFKTKGDNRK